MSVQQPTRLELRSATVRVRGRTLLEDVDLQVAQGELVALVGPNGAGKTSLLRAALGLLPYQGSVQLAGREVEQWSARERAGLLAWLPQHSQLAEPITALELVMAARYRFAETRPTAERAALEALHRAGAAAFARRLVSELSGGEQQRVALAALIAQQAPLLLLDEPANHLDPAQQIDLYVALGELWHAGHGLLCITHDVNLLRHMLPQGGARGGAEVRVVGLASGRVQFETHYDDPELARQLGTLFEVHIDVVERDGQRLLWTRGRA